MADTAKALFIVGGLVKQLTTADTLALNSLDAISASGTLAIGGANTATLNLGTHANTTALTIGGAGLATLDIGTGMGATNVINIGGTGAQVNINANLRVEGTETVIGDTTFNNPVTFTEEVTFGDVAAPITTITYHSSTRITSNMTWAETTAGNDYVLTIDTSTTGAGNGFQLLGGAGLTNSIGGQIKLVSGAGTGTQAGAGATLVLAGGAAAGANATLAAAGGSTAGGKLTLSSGNAVTSGSGGNIELAPGSGSGVLGTFGGSILLHGGSSAAPGADGSVYLYGTVYFENTAHDVAARVSFAPNSGTRIVSDVYWTGSAAYVIGQHQNQSAGGAGADFTVQAGDANGTGDPAIGGSLHLKAGNASGVGTAGGNISLTPGIGGTTKGAVVFGHTGGTGEKDFQIFADTDDARGEAGLRFNAATNRWQIQTNQNAADAFVWTNIATGSAIGDGSDDYQHLEWDGGSWQPVNSITLPNVPGLSIKPAANSAGSGQKLVVSAGEGNSQPGGDLSLRGGFGKSSTNGSVLIGDSTTSTVVLGVTDTWTFTTSTGMLAPAGAANINLPSLFQINSDAVSASVTADNLSELTGGGTTTLHSHSAGGSIVVSLTWSGVSTKQAVYVSGASTVAPADADAGAEASARVVGIGTTSGNVQTVGIATCIAAGAIAAGAPVYLSGTAGSVTSTAPSSGYMTRIGIATTGAADTADVSVLLQIAPPIFIA